MWQTLTAGAIARAVEHELARQASDQPGGYFQRWPNGRVSLELDNIDMMEFAVSVREAAAMADRSVEQVLRSAEEKLKTARFGLSDMHNPERMQSGLYNAVVFGRMVTFAIQNLRHLVSDFDDWYTPKQDEMRNDVLLRYFHNLRTDIEHRADSHTTTSAQLRITSQGLQRFQPAPPGATSLFIGDETGGSGWEITLPDGSTEKYYVDLPDEVGMVTVHLRNVPREHEDKTARELVEMYLAWMDRLLVAARSRFGG